MANRAKVSHTAVSAVVNNIPGRVSEATRQRILKAIRELDYKPNKIARQLVSGKSDSILVCFGTTDLVSFLSPDANQLSAGIWKCAIEHDMSLQFAPIPLPINDMEKIMASIPSRSVDGAIILGPIPRKKHVLDMIENSSKPIVCIDSYPDFVNTSTVDSDNLQGMKIGTQCLISRGHKQIMYLGPLPAYQCDVDRLCGFSEAITESGIDVNERMVKILPPERVTTALKEAFESSDKPTALVCSGYQYSLEAWDTLMSMGIRVPDDITMLTFDILPPGHVGLDSVIAICLSFYDMGKVAMEVLKELIDGDRKAPARIRLVPQLIIPPSQQ